LADLASFGGQRDFSNRGRRLKPQNQTDDIFLAQILGHKLLGPNASLSVGQSYKDFYIRKP
jgi:hypothetical protein